MARPVEMREDYLEDLIRLKRLLAAVELDDRQPLSWRDDTSALIHDLCAKLATAKRDYDR